MNTISICALAFGGCLLSMTVSGEHKTYGKIVSLLVCLMIIGALLMRAKDTFGFFNGICNRYSWNNYYVSLLMKMAGITLLTEVTADLCTQAENPVCAKQIKMLGRFCMLTAGLPLVTELFRLFDGVLR